MTIQPEPTEAERQRLREEYARLGPDAEARIRAVESYITAQVGSDLAGDITGRLATAKQIEGWERIIANGRAQQRAAATASSASTPTPPREDAKVSEEQYARMSHAERIEYTRRFRNGGDR
jgi:hypothetical protein